MSRLAHTRPPAKLNLFLDVLGKRDDGFHEIDTVMVPIDWCDELRVQRRQHSGVGLNVQWLPSEQVIAQRLGVTPNASENLLSIPSGETNLVHRAVTQFIETFEIDGGFDCELGKRIPAGAGLGGASSDAASALRCCAALCGIAQHEEELWEIAASIGSDVPFFLGMPNDRGDVDALRSVRARGRGEVLEPVNVSSLLHFVVVYPGVSLSTSTVYANYQHGHSPYDSERFLAEFQSGDPSRFGSHMVNQLTDAAKKLTPEISEILESLWRMGLRTCQLTGSGSACFAIASSANEARRCAAIVRAILEPGAIVMASRGALVPPRVNLT